ncbi:hypothetical protein MTR62_11475 [Novosphingobium sp. 1949]|uniref:DUF4129 domain-containing protein n=1 Tax=Novosphingobium organovorum TaxID=2930092 RepID=A0ABT0BE07_9SPHN|nr:hypothetical protein [Novosphingobium organovorum]MCJ2183306.1 hypothetical protein [Novosphingobium organovorum]
MTVGADQIAGAPATQGATGDWEAVHASSQIQFTPLPEVAPEIPRIPEWLQALGRLLEAIFAPIGRLLGMSWPVFQWVLLGLAALLVLYAAWRLLRPVWDRRWRAGRAGEEEPASAPSQAEAEALLADADRLAAEGRFDEATHLLLRRSVRQIADQRPDWLHPASTAREIAALSALPTAGRVAFTVIAERVERCRYALRALDAEDWSAARAAYAQFAAVRLRGGEGAA